jgi:hypothetical protein
VIGGAVPAGAKLDHADHGTASTNRRLTPCPCGQCRTQCRQLQLLFQHETWSHPQGVTGVKDTE